jgi:HEAT repeat protein
MRQLLEVGLCVALFLHFHTHPAQESVTDLVKGLDSPRPEERNDAASKLLSIGKPALEELEKAGRSGSSELALRARQLIKRIQLRDQIPSRILKLSPGLDEQLATGSNHAWTEAFLKLSEEEHSEKSFPGVRNRDLEAIAPAALAAATSVEEQLSICQRIMKRGLSVPLPSLQLLSKADSPELRATALSAISVQAVEPQVVATLIHALKDQDPACRVAAIDGLAQAGSDAATEPLVDLLKDPSPEVVAHVLQALGTLGYRQGARTVASFLRNPAPAVRSSAVAALASLGPSPAADDALGVLADPSAGCRISALEALAQIGGPLLGARILPLLDDPDPRVQVAAMETLGKWGNHEAIPALRHLLASENASIRDAALLALSWIVPFDLRADLERLLSGEKDPTVLATAVEAVRTGKLIELAPSLETLLRHPEEEVRSKVVDTLADLGDRRLANHLDDLLRDDKVSVRGFAISAIGRFKIRSYEDRLFAMLTDPDKNIQSDAAFALGQIGTSDGCRHLKKILEDERADVRANAAWIAGNLRCLEQVPILERLLDDPEESVRGQVAWALGELGDEAAAERLWGLVREDDVSSASAALSAVARLQPARAQAFALDHLGGHRPGLRSSSLEVLARTSTPYEVSRILPLLDNRNYQVRIDAHRELAHRKAPSWKDHLTAMFLDPNAYCRAEAARLARQGGEAEVEKALLALLADPDETVRYESAAALALRGRREGRTVLLHSPRYARFLNALKDPVLWKALEAKSGRDLEKGEKTGILDWLGAVSKLLGCRLKISENADLRNILARSEWGDHFDSKPLLESLGDLDDLSADMVIDGGELRVLTPAESHAFWIGWIQKER